MSLRTRLLIAIGVIALVALAIADVVTYSALESFLYQRADQQLDQFNGRYENLVESGQLLTPAACAGPGQFAPGFRGSGESDGDDTPPSNAIQAFAVEVRSASSGGIVDSQSCAAYVNGTAYTPQISGTIPGLPARGGAGQVAYFDAPATQAGGPAFRVRATSLGDGEVLIVAQPLGDIGSTLHHLMLVELAVTGAAVVVALIGGLWLVRIGLRPLRDMELTAESIAAGNLTERVPGENDSTEVGRLARTLNVMLSRIESAFSARLASESRLRASDQQLRRFVADASHELRTPIAAISAYAELFGRGASEQKEDLERLMGGIRNETSRMEHLVADLLLLARLDEGRPMERRSVDLVALCAEAVHTASTVGPGWPVTFEASRPIEVMGDATSLRQVVDNLLGNVRAHTPSGTTARVRVDADEDGAIITVSDTGPGMEPDEAAHVFERFYRSDPSRSRAHGGAGLGLSIVSAIVVAHGGTVAAHGAAGAGTTFTVHLPASPPTDSPAPLPPTVGQKDSPAGPVVPAEASANGASGSDSSDGAETARETHGLAHSHQGHRWFSSKAESDPPQSKP
jgi:two-component system, OmpR family, sensor kinase